MREPIQWLSWLQEQSKNWGFTSIKKECQITRLDTHLANSLQGHKTITFEVVLSTREKSTN